MWSNLSSHKIADFVDFEDNIAAGIDVECRRESGSPNYLIVAVGIARVDGLIGKARREIPAKAY